MKLLPLLAVTSLLANIVFIARSPTHPPLPATPAVAPGHAASPPPKADLAAISVSFNKDDSNRDTRELPGEETAQTTDK